MKISLLRFISPCFAVLFSCVSVLAESGSDLKILDSDGFMRAAQKIGTESMVALDVVDQYGKPLNGPEFSLTNRETSKKLISKANKGVVSFPSVTPGAWVVTTSAPGVTVTNVVIGEGGVIAVGGTSAARASLAAGGTGSAAAGGASGAGIGAAAAGAGAGIGAVGAVAAAAVVGGSALAINEATSDDDDDDIEISPAT